MTRLVWADAETTGIRPDMGAEIWELALIVRNEPGSAGSDEEWAWHLRPDLTRADPMSLKVGGYYERCKVARLSPGIGRRVAQPPDVDPDVAVMGAEGIAHLVADLLNGAHLIAANPAFDGGHLDAFLRKYGECLMVDYHYIDLGSLVRGWAHGSFAHIEVPFPLGVADAARLARIDPAGYDLHTALGDARLARDVFDVVTGGAG